MIKQDNKHIASDIWIPNTRTWDANKILQILGQLALQSAMQVHLAGHDTILDTWRI
jgi:hypothetical protein